MRTSTLTQIGHVEDDFAGDIDEVRVFSRALSTAEIAAYVHGVAQTANFSHSSLDAGVPLFFTANDARAKTADPSSLHSGPLELERRFLIPQGDSVQRAACGSDCSRRLYRMACGALARIEGS